MLSLANKVQVLGAMFSIDNLTGVELWKPILQLPQPYGLVVIYALVLPLVYVLSNSIANFFFRDALILRVSKPPCHGESAVRSPSCILLALGCCRWGVLRLGFGCKVGWAEQLA